MTVSIIDCQIRTKAASVQMGESDREASLANRDTDNDDESYFWFFLPIKGNEQRLCRSRGHYRVQVNIATAEHHC